MFTDRVTIHLLAGRGGNGVTAWTRAKFLPKGGPCGGNGGKGGSVHITASHDLFSLDHFRNTRILKAKNGGDGGSNCRAGKQGSNHILRVPCGTLVKNVATGDIIADLTDDGQTIEICHGGRGGLGNSFFKSPTNRTPTKCTPGRAGEEIEVELELKLIADVGFVGLPNAGKSTLLSALTPHQVKIGDYPFTTLKPNLSYIEFDDYSRIYLADIPGIIKDAHVGRGLGLEFLKHIERSHVLVFILDASQTPEEDFTLLKNELAAYNPALLDRPMIICLNKSDLALAKENIESFHSHHHGEIQVISTTFLDEKTLRPLIQAMRDCAQATCVRY